MEHRGSSPSKSYVPGFKLLDVFGPFWPHGQASANEMNCTNAALLQLGVSRLVTSIPNLTQTSEWSLW